MAEGMNKAILLGNLGADAELRVTQGGSAVLKLRLATSETFLNKDKQREERTEWHRCTIFGKRAEALAPFLTKGTRVLVEGRITTTSYEKNGEKKYSTEIIVNDLKFAGGGQKKSQGESDDELPPPTGAGDEDLPF